MKTTCWASTLNILCYRRPFLECESNKYGISLEKGSAQKLLGIKIHDSRILIKLCLVSYNYEKNVREKIKK